MAFGAAYIAANQSQEFRTKDIFLSDGFNFEIDLTVKNLEEIDEGHVEYYNKKTTLFGL